MYIYTDIVDPQPVSDIVAPLLRIVGINNINYLYGIHQQWHRLDSHRYCPPIDTVLPGLLETSNCLCNRGRGIIVAVPLYIMGHKCCYGFSNETWNMTLYWWMQCFWITKATLSVWITLILITTISAIPVSLHNLQQRTQHNQVLHNESFSTRQPLFKYNSKPINPSVLLNSVLNYKPQVFSLQKFDSPGSDFKNVFKILALPSKLYFYVSSYLLINNLIHKNINMSDSNLSFRQSQIKDNIKLFLDKLNYSDNFSSSQLKILNHNIRKFLIEFLKNTSNISPAKEIPEKQFVNKSQNLALPAFHFNNTLLVFEKINPYETRKSDMEIVMDPYQKIEEHGLLLQELSVDTGSKIVSSTYSSEYPLKVVTNPVNSSFSLYGNILNTLFPIHYSNKSDRSRYLMKKSNLTINNQSKYFTDFYNKHSSRVSNSYDYPKGILKRKIRSVGSNISSGEENSTFESNKNLELFNSSHDVVIKELQFNVTNTDLNLQNNSGMISLINKLKTANSIYEISPNYHSEKWNGIKKEFGGKKTLIALLNSESLEPDLKIVSHFSNKATFKYPKDDEKFNNKELSSASNFLRLSKVDNMLGESLPQIDHIMYVNKEENIRVKSGINSKIFDQTNSSNTKANSRGITELPLFLPLDRKRQIINNVTHGSETNFDHIQKIADVNSSSNISPVILNINDTYSFVNEFGMSTSSEFENNSTQDSDSLLSALGEELNETLPSFSTQNSREKINSSEVIVGMRNSFDAASIIGIIFGIVVLITLTGK
uniref:Uncharacterized protein n=1 Tax=Timema monikensis TaxID=170555 RepID=A0A7R9EHC8_9NEOP|nr:unnamed protein product [Timema monikensis]